MPDLQAFYPLLIFIIGLVSNVIGGVISGGASLFSISLLLLIGLPPSMTMSTYMIGTIPARLSATWGYRKSGKILWKYVPYLAILGFMGSLIGSTILVTTQESIVSTIVGLLLIAFIPLLLLKSSRGLEHTNVSKKWLFVGHILYFLLAIWTSFFAAWTGIICLYLYIYFFGFTILETKATDSVSGLAMSLGALLVFVSSGEFNLHYLFAYIPGAAIGGYIGAKSALRLGNARLRILLWLSITIVSAKTLFQAKSAQFINFVLLIFR